MATKAKIVEVTPEHVRAAELESRIHRYVKPIHERLAAGEMTKPEIAAVKEFETRTGMQLLNPVAKFAAGLIGTSKKKVAKRVASTGEVVKRGSRQELVNKLVAANPTLGRSEMIKLIMAEIGMTKAGASTYFHNAMKVGK
jgi:hypothetical protein